VSQFCGSLRATPEAAALFDGLGYDRLAIGATRTGDYEPQAGGTTARTSITVEDAGAIDLAYDVSGLTQDWIDRMITVSAGAPDDDPTVLLPLASELSLESALFRFADRSIVDRALRLAAQAQGLDAETYRAQLQGAVPFMMTQAVPIPDLQQELTQAVQAFLGGGRTIAVEARPAAPVPVSILMQAAQTAPQTLPDLLGLRIAVEE